jgi:hypothetical protein
MSEPPAAWEEISDDYDPGIVEGLVLIARAVDRLAAEMGAVAYALAHRGPER